MAEPDRDLLLDPPAQAAPANDFPDLASLERAILDFERYYIEIAEPFQWRFTRAQLNRLLARIAAEQTMPAHPAPCQLAA